MNLNELNPNYTPQFRIVLLFWGESDYLDFETGAIESSQNAYRMSPKWGKSLKDLFPYYTAAIKGDTWKNRVPRKLVIYEGETEIFRLPQGTGAITDRKGNIQQRLKSLKEWRECIEMYERTNGRQFRPSFNYEPKNGQKIEQIQPVASISNQNLILERKKRVWEQIKFHFQKENLIVDTADEKHVKNELLSRKETFIESYFEEAMTYLRAAHDRFQVAREEAEKIKKGEQEFKNPVFKPIPKVTTNSNSFSSDLDKKKAEAVQELYNFYQEKHKKQPSNGRVNVWQNVFIKSHSEIEITNHLTEMRQSI